MYTGEPDPSGASERGKFGRAANDKLILLPRVRPGMSLIGSILSVESRVRIYRYFFFFDSFDSSGFLRELNSTV